MRNLLSDYLSATAAGTSVKKAYRSDRVRGLGRRNVQPRRASTNANRDRERNSLANAIDKLQVLILQDLIQRGVVSKAEGVKFKLPARVLADIESLRSDLRDMMKSYENVKKLTSKNVRKLTNKLTKSGKKK